MLFHGTRRLGTWYGIETRPTERTSILASTVSGWSRSLLYEIGELPATGMLWSSSCRTF